MGFARTSTMLSTRRRLRTGPPTRSRTGTKRRWWITAGVRATHRRALPAAAGRAGRQRTGRSQHAASRRHDLWCAVDGPLWLRPSSHQHSGQGMNPLISALPTGRSVVFHRLSRNSPMPATRVGSAARRRWQRGQFSGVGHQRERHPGGAGALVSFGHGRGADAVLA